MTGYLKFAAIGASALAMAACTSSGTAERNAVAGAALGAAAGAAAGAARGCSKAGDCGTGNRPDNYDPYNYDSDGDGVVDARDRYPNDRRNW